MLADVICIQHPAAAFVQLQITHSMPCLLAEAETHLLAIVQIYGCALVSGREMLACSESLQRKVCACTSACVPCILHCRNDEVTIQPVTDLAVAVAAVTVSAAYAHLGCTTISAAAMLSA